MACYIECYIFDHSTIQSIFIYLEIHSFKSCKFGFFRMPSAEYKSVSPETIGNNSEI